MKHHELAELKALAAALQILSQVLDETRTALEETNKRFPLDDDS